MAEVVAVGEGLAGKVVIGVGTLENVVEVQVLWLADAGLNVDIVTDA